VKNLDVFLYLHEDFLPSYGYLGHKPESFQSLLQIRSLILRTPRSLSTSWTHYQQEEPGPLQENPSEPFEQILVSLCQTIPSFHFTSSILQNKHREKQKEKTHLIHLSSEEPEEEAKIKNPSFQPLSLPLIIEKWIHQLTSTEKAFMGKNDYNIRLEVSKTFLMSDGILEIITILLRMIHPLLLNQINFQNKEEIKTRQNEIKTETKKGGDFLFQSFKEAFPFLTSREEDPENFIKDLLTNPSKTLGQMDERNQYFQHQKQNRNEERISLIRGIT
jgi:hypothetical protein